MDHFALDSRFDCECGAFGNPKEVLMQYTGRPDKNGVEIYEGDIVKINLMENLNIFWVTILGKIYWDENKYGWMVNTGTDGQPNIRDFGYLYNCEVIGNIYENPELIEG